MISLNMLALFYSLINFYCGKVNLERGRLRPVHLSAAERSYPMSEVRSRSWEDPMPEGWWPRGVTPRLRSGAAAESARLRWRRNGGEELPKSEVRGGGREENVRKCTPGLFLPRHRSPWKAWISCSLWLKCVTPHFNPKACCVSNLMSVPRRQGGREYGFHTNAGWCWEPKLQNTKQ